MTINISEDEKAYHVKAEVPGVKREDIDVEIEGNHVSLSAEVRREKEERKGENVVHTERYVGKQFRSFTLRDEIDEDKAQAKMVDGVLELTLPKKATVATHKAAVQ